MKHASRFAVLKKVLDDAEIYFSALEKVQSSAINQIETAGFRQASRLYNRRFSNQVSKGVKEHSLLQALCKNVRLLYGKQWRTHFDGKLSEPSALQLVSTSFEIPRMEEIDPEGMTLKRLQVSNWISRLNREMNGRETSV